MIYRQAVGWARPQGARAAHYFPFSDDSSLCGTWRYTRGKVTGLDEDPDHCLICHNAQKRLI